MAKTTRAKNTPSFGYFTYRWGGEHDPVLDLFQTAVERSGMKPKDIAEKAGMSPSTVHGYLEKRIRTPRHANIKAAFRAIPDYDYEVTFKGRSMKNGGK